MSLHSERIKKGRLKKEEINVYRHAYHIVQTVLLAQFPEADWGDGWQKGATLSLWMFVLGGNPLHIE